MSTTPTSRCAPHVKLADPKTVVEQKIVMRRGVDVKGSAVCSDGKPAAGWHILALPGWWDFMAFPTGELINGDGSFVCTTSVPERKRVDFDSDRSRGEHEPIRTPRRRSDESTRPIGCEARLSVARCDGSYRGRIRYIGGTPKRGFWVQADSDKGAGSTAATTCKLARRPSELAHFPRADTGSISVRLRSSRSSLPRSPPPRRICNLTSECSASCRCMALSSPPRGATESRSPTFAFAW